MPRLCRDPGWSKKGERRIEGCYPLSKSLMALLTHKTAWEVPDGVMPQPAIVPASLIAKPTLQQPAGSVPRSVRPAACVQMNACW